MSRGRRLTISRRRGTAGSDGSTTGRPVVPAMTQPGWGDASARMIATADMAEGAFYPKDLTSVLDPNCAAYSTYGPSAGLGQVRTYPVSPPGDGQPFGAPNSETHVYHAQRTLRVEDGWFKGRLRSEMVDGTMKGLGVSLIPTINLTRNEQRGGLFLTRIRADRMVGRGAVVQNIRQSAADRLKWPDSGELDWPEGPSFIQNNLGGYFHYADSRDLQKVVGVAGNSFDYDAPELVSTGGGCIYAQEWLPSSVDTMGTDGRIRWWRGVKLDAQGTIISMGTLALDSTDRVPGIPMQWLMQSGRAGAPSDPPSTGELKVAWMCAYQLPAGATALPAVIGA